MNTKKFRNILANILIFIINFIAVGLICLFAFSMLAASFQYVFIERPKEFAGYPKYNFNGKEYFKKTTVEPNKRILRELRDPVVYNIETNIFHEPWCEWSEQCTDNCVYMERRIANKFGRHCYVCEHIYDEVDDPDMDEFIPERFQ